MKRILSIILLLSITHFGFSQAAGDFRSFATGDWSAAATWERYDGAAWVAASSAPALADGAINILTGHTVSIAASLSIDSVFVNTGGILNINSGTTTTVGLNGGLTGIRVQGTMNVNGKILNQGSVNNSGGTVAFNNGSEYEHALNAGSIPTATWNTGSTCNITGVTANAPSNANQNFYNFTWNNIGQNANLNISWSGNTVSGTLRMKSAGANRLQLTNNLAAGPNNFPAINNPITMTVNNIVVEANTLTTHGSSNANGFVNYTLNVLGNIDVIGTGIFSLSSGTSANGVTLNLFGNLTLTSSTANCFAKGTVYASATGVNKTVFSKSGTQVYTKLSTSSISTANIFEVASGAMVDLNTSIISNGVGSFTILPGGGIATGAPGGFNDNFTSGTQTLTFDPTANYMMNGALVQTMGSKFVTASGGLCNNLIINNSGAAGADTVKLAGALLVNGALTLTDGLLLPSTTNTLTLSNTATVVGGSAASYVCKRMTRQTNSTNAYFFPIGKGTYRPCTVIPSDALAGSYDAEYYNVSHSNTTSFTAPVTGVSNLEYWDISKTSGTSAKVSFDLNGTAVPGATASDDIGIGHFTSSAWKWENGFGITTGNATSGTVISDYLTSFSPFTFAILPDGTVSAPIPVKLSSFKATYNGTSVNLFWNSSNEVNFNKYIIEKSTDGVRFTNAGEIKGNNYTYASAYSFEDKGIVSGIVYYRLKMLDLDGTIKYSNILVINAKLINSIKLYPNPATDVVNIVLPKSSSASIINIIAADGRVVAKDKVNAGTIVSSISVSQLLSGNYQLQIINPEFGNKTLSFTK